MVAGIARGTPFGIMANKVFYAAGLGCTIVMKLPGDPLEAPIIAGWRAAAPAEHGRLVRASGSLRPPVNNPGIDKVSFTGSTEAASASPKLRRPHRPLHARTRRQVGGGRDDFPIEAAGILGNTITVMNGRLRHAQPRHRPPAPA